MFVSVSKKIIIYNKTEIINAYELLNKNNVICLLIINAAAIEQLLSTFLCFFLFPVLSRNRHCHGFVNHTIGITADPFRQRICVVCGT